MIQISEADLSNHRTYVKQTYQITVLSEADLSTYGS